MAGRTAKVSAATWIETARRVLLEEGIAGVKVDRLANRLGVTRGGFYHNFKDREDLLAKLLANWEEHCRFLPPNPPGSTPTEALEWLDQLLVRLIEEDGYDHQYDMAVREWARSDQRAEWAVERSDRERIAMLQRFFRALGYGEQEATVRARVFYYHQIGYYAIGVQQSIAERRRILGVYIDILCGAEQLKKARESAGRKRLKLSVAG